MFGFFALDALVSTMTTATRAQGPFTSTQAGYRAAVIQEISASRESVSEKKKKHFRSRDELEDGHGGESHPSDDRIETGYRI